MLQYIKADHFDKTAGVFKFVSKMPKSIKYPLFTAAGIAGTGLVLGAANKAHGLYNITSEMRKRKVMKKQIELLQQIADQGKKEKVVAVPKQKLIINPLT